MKRIIAFLLVLCVVCSSVWAFPNLGSLFGRKSQQPVASEVSSEQEAPVVVEETITATVEAKPLEEMSTEELWEEVLDSLEPSSPDVQKTLENLETLLVELQNSSRMTKQQLSEATSQLEGIKADMELVALDSEAKDETIAAQAEDIRYYQKKANAFHFFVNTGAVLGFKNAQPTVGVLGNVGVQFSNGLTVGTGAQYTIWNGGWDIGWSIDKLAVTATIGWTF